MKFLLLISLFLLFSCNLHEQKSVVAGKKESKAVNLSVIETISSAIIQNDIGLIKETLGNGNFELNVPDKNGDLLLNKAISSHRLIIGKILIERGADPEVVNGEGISAKTLIEQSEFKLDWQALFNGEKITETTGKNKLFEFIAGAVRENDQQKYIEMMKGFFEIGAPVNGQNERKFSYLMDASANNLQEVIEYLCTLEGIDPNIKVVVGRGSRKKTFTALTLTTSSEIKEILYACGAVDQIL